MSSAPRADESERPARATRARRRRRRVPPSALVLLQLCLPGARGLDGRLADRPARPKRPTTTVEVGGHESEGRPDEGGGRRRAKATGKKTGAFNPHLTTHDPNHADYRHGNPSGHSVLKVEEPSSWSPCPDDASFAGNRASRDCLHYVYCANGKPRGEYTSCHGLMFDNARGTCDWAETVDCGGSGGGVGGSAKGIVAAGTGGRPNVPGVSKEMAAQLGWSGGEDWGGSWVGGKWVPSGESARSPASAPSEFAWVEQEWKGEVGPYPPHEVLRVHEIQRGGGSDDPTALPREHVSREGWSSATRTRTVVGYYSVHNWYDNGERSKPANLQLSKVDRVNFAFFQLDESGSVWGTDSYADQITLFGPDDWSVTDPQRYGYAPQFNDDNGFDDGSGSEWNYVGRHHVDLPDRVYCHRSNPAGKRDCRGHRARDGLIERAHAQGALVYPSIGGWSLSGPYSALAANAKARRNFAKNCVGLVREYNFDGIDIDWEFPGYVPHGGTPDDTRNYVLLLRDVRAALDSYAAHTYPNGERVFGLTAAMPCTPSLIEIQDVASISSILDEVNLMSYDFHGTWNDRVGVNAPLYDQPPDLFDSPGLSVHSCVDAWADGGAARSKLNIGVPFYGRSYADGVELYGEFGAGADGAHWHADGGVPQYYSIEEKLSEMITLRDGATRTQYAFFADGGIVSFDDRESVCDKVEYTRKEGLSGMIIWDLSGDLNEDLMTPLLDVINFKLQLGDDFACDHLRLETRDENGDVFKLEKKDNPWYAVYATGGECINDGKQPVWENEENLFRHKEECCMVKFEYRFDDCLGPPTYPPTAKPTRQPTKSPMITDEPTLNPSAMWAGAQVMDSTLKASVDAPVTWCLGGCGGRGKCVGNQNHPQNIADSDCKPCDGGQKYWPCDVDGLCFCWDESKPRIPPAPSSGKAQLSDERPCEYFTKSMFNSLAPEARHPYTYEGLCDAIDNYNEGHAEKIFMMGTEFEKKSELAAFLGHTLHESDEWKAAREYLICADNVVQGGETFCKPCDSGSFNWETFKCDGVGLAGGGLTYNGYCDQVLQPPQACECDPTLKGGMDGGPEGYIPASKVFFGRGAIQLSWNYNFRAASEALAGDPATFCENPDLVATEPAYAWGAGVFFWMESLKEETTCHKEALAGDFGGTLNTINGGLECPAYHGGWHGEAIKLRINRYCKSTRALGLESILIMDGCKGLNNSFAECLHDGSCPACDQFSDDVGTWVPHTELPAMKEAPAVTTKPPETTTTTVSTTIRNSDAEEANGVPEFSVPKGCEDGYKAVDGLPGCCVPEPSYHGDGACDADAPYNTPLCNFDGGDCCRETCDLKNSMYKCRSVEYGPFGFFCLNPDAEEYIDPSACTVPDKSKIGDGECNGLEYNNAACGYDGGDCCEETCDARYAHYECGAVPYNCVDPEHRETPKPTETPTTARPTSEPTSRAPTNQPTKKPTNPPIAAADEEPLPNSEQVHASLVSIVASADSSLMKSSPDKNFGADAKLSVRGNSNNPSAHESIIKFYIPASDFPTSTPVSAVLRVFSLVDSDSGGIFHVVGNDKWSEDGVSWNSAPMWDAQGRIDSIGQIRVNTWYTIDVSDAVARLKGEAGHISIRIRSRTSDVVEYSSKEGPSPPELMIAYGRQTIPDPPQVKTEEVAVLTQPPTMLPTSKPSNPPSSLPTAPPVQVQMTFNIEASRDSTLIKKHPDSNYGNQPSLIVQGMSSGPNAHDAIMRFKIPGRPADIPASTQMHATFNIYSLVDAVDGGIFHLAPEAGPWDEKKITWNNSPDWVDRLGKIGAVRKGELYTIDVTEAIASLGGAAGIVNVRARSRSPSVAEYSSREGRHPPTIFVSYGDMEQNFAFGSKPTYSTTDSSATTSKPTKMPTARPTSPSFVATEPGEYVLGPSDDAVIVELHPTDNYGGQDELMVDRDSGTLDSLLRFALSGIDTDLISRATLRLYCTDGSDFGGEFRRTISSKWDETTVVWENAPRGYGSPLHTLRAVQANKWYEIDLTAMVVGMQDDLSIRIHSSASDNRAAFSSKEGAHPPQLVFYIGEIEEETVTTVAPSDSTSTIEPVSTCCRDSGSMYYPLWSHGIENVECSADRPTWAVGVYLKETKLDCCRTFFKLQEDQCIEFSNSRLL